MITKSYYKLVKVSYEDSGYFYVKNVSDQAGTLTMNGSNNLGINLEYSTDGVNWTTADPNAPFSLLVPAGANVYMRGTNSSLNEKTINMDVNHTVGGNVYSLLDKATYASRTTSVGDNEFTRLFQGNTHLVSAADLNFGNVTTLSNYCYSYMFLNCTSLSEAPSILPAATLEYSCYTNMFAGCTNLATAPELPATTLSAFACYNNMFVVCESLTSVKIGVTTWNTSNTSNWLKDVSASGTIYAPTGSDIANYSGASGVPSGWTVVYY